MNVSNILYASLIFLSASAAAFAQPPNARFERYGLEQGLSQSVIYKILQDKHGFIWIATEDGLNRFNGVNFKIYKKDMQPQGLPWNTIIDMVEDSTTNSIWLATAKKGVCVLDCVQETLVRVPSPVTSPLSDESVNSICTSGQFVFAAGKQGVFIFDKKRHVVVKNIFMQKEIVEVLPADKGKIVFFSADGYAYILNGSSLSIEHEIKPGNLIADQQVVIINNVVKEHDGALSICTRAGLYKALSLQELIQGHLLKTKLVTVEKSRDLSGRNITSSFTDFSNNHWISMDSVGILFKRPHETNYYLIQKTADNPHSLSDNYCSQIMQDKDSTIWIASEKGCNHQIPVPSFIQTLGQEHDPVYKRLNRLFAIGSLDDKKILLGRLSDIVVYDRANGGISLVKNETGIDPGRIYFIQPVNDQFFWIGCKRGIRILEKQHEGYLLRNPALFPELQSMYNQRITALLAIDEENVLIGGIGNAGLTLWNKKKHTLVNFVHTAGAHSLPDNNITKIFKDRTGNCWIATEGGLSKFDLTTHTFNNYFLKTATSEAHYINDILELEGDLWMAFYQEGLVKWNKKNNQAVLYNNKQGLLNNSVSNIRNDNNGNIWISTNGGLSAFNIRKSLFTNYTTKDGIQDNEFNRFCVHETKDNLYFGGISGFSVVDKNSSNIFRPFPAVSVTGLQFLQGTQYTPYEKLYSSTNVSLPYYENNLIFQYACLDFSSNHRIQYAYMLEGYDHDWIVNTSPYQTSITYTNLAPGSYTLKVKAVNREYTGAPKIGTLLVTIVPAWYQTLFFRILLALCSAGLLFYFIRLYYKARLRKQRLEYETMLAVQKERQRISSEIHDDIGAGLSGIRLLTEMTGHKITNEDVQKEVKKIYDSVSDLSGKMRDVIWSLNTDNDTLGNLFFYIQRQAYQLFENSPVKLHVILSKVNIPDIMIGGEMRRHVYLCVKEALHNCLKHAKADECTVQMELAGDWLNIQIADNGTGFAIEEKMNAGYGLGNMRKRIQSIDGQMLIKTTHGCRIELMIPLKNQL